MFQANTSCGAPEAGCITSDRWAGRNAGGANWAYSVCLREGAMAPRKREMLLICEAGVIPLANGVLIARCPPPIAHHLSIFNAGDGSLKGGLGKVAFESCRGMFGSDANVLA